MDYTKQIFGKGDDQGPVTVLLNTWGRAVCVDITPGGTTQSPEQMAESHRKFTIARQLTAQGNDSLS